MNIDPGSGDLVMRTSGGEVHQRKPLIYQDLDGVRREIAGQCQLQSIFLFSQRGTGRMDKVIYLPPPDLQARKEMFKLHLKDRPTEKDIDIGVGIEDATAD
jgi:hypothetical protein